MLKLDNNLLDELGLGTLPDDQKRAMLQHIYETLELRVGTNLANQMTDQQLEEFEKFIDDGGDANQAQALQWLEANLPNYKQVVNDVFEALKGEIKQMAPQLLSSAQQSSPTQPGQPQVTETVQPEYAPPQPAQQQYAPPTPNPVAPQQPAAPYGDPSQPYFQEPGQMPQQQYQYPQQQPPAGPGQQQPPQYPPQQAA